MIRRIVKLTFEPEKVPEFQDLFEATKHFIRGFDGCQHLELLQQVAPSNVFFTYSFWENEEALERYRNSDLFKTTWKKTKALFADKPQAWSTTLASQTDEHGHPSAG